MIRSSLESKTYILAAKGLAVSVERYSTLAEPPLDTKQPGHRWTRWLLIVAGFAVVAGIILALRGRAAPFQWRQFLAALTDLNWAWLSTAIFFILLTYVGRALRWEVMLRPLRPKPDFAGLCSATVIGFTAIVLLGRAGELVRPYLIATREQVPFSSQMAAWFIERILDTLAVLMIFGFALGAGGEHLHWSVGLSWVVRTGGYLIGGICVLCVLFLVAFRNFSRETNERILGALAFLPDAVRERIQNALAAFDLGMGSIRESRFLVWLLFYTAIEWGVMLGGYYALFRAFPATAQFGWTDVMVFLGLIAFGSIVQIPGIGGGVQVATVVVLTEVFGLTLEVASGIAVLIWVLGFASIVPFGLLLAFREGINWKKLKKLPRDVTAHAKS